MSSSYSAERAAVMIVDAILVASTLVSHDSPKMLKMMCPKGVSTLMNMLPSLSCIPLALNVRPLQRVCLGNLILSLAGASGAEILMRRCASDSANAVITVTLVFGHFLVHIGLANSRSAQRAHETGNSKNIGMKLSFRDRVRDAGVLY